MYSKNDRRVWKHESFHVDSRFVRCFAAGHFTVGHLAHFMAALHRQFVFRRGSLVMMRRYRALAGRAARHLAGHPCRLREGNLEQHDGKQA